MINRRTLPLSALRAFESAALHQHLGKAGEELGVTYGAISHHIRALEDKLDVKLFYRVRNHLELTPSGMTLYESVKEGLDIIIDGTQNLKNDELSGSLTVACTQTIATSWAAKHFCEFRTKYPSIQLIIREIEPKQLDIPSDIDIAICYGKPKENDKKIKKLASPLLYPVCSPSLLSSNKRITKTKGLSEFTLLHYDQVSWSKWFKKFDFPIPDSSQNIYFPNASQALTTARLGYGVALCNTFETQEFIREGQLIHLSEKSIDEENDYFIYSRVDRDTSYKTRIFEDWIIEACTPEFK